MGSLQPLGHLRLVITEVRVGCRKNDDRWLIGQCQMCQGLHGTQAHLGSKCLVTTGVGCYTLYVGFFLFKKGFMICFLTNFFYFLMIMYSALLQVLLYKIKPLYKFGI